MRADLHFHSIYSDGEKTPAELAKAAKAAGVQLVSCTDHDNFGGDGEKRAAFEALSLTYLTGVELSAYRGNLKVHITGYGYDAQSALCKKYQDLHVKNSYLRLQDVIERLKFYKNIRLSEQAVRAVMGDKDGPVHTMHVAQALATAGYYPDRFAAFKDCFLPGVPTHSLAGRLTPEEAIRILHELGGVACVAHPGRIFLEFAEREKLLRSLKEAGLDGIECTYSTHTEEDTRYFIGLAEKMKLLKTGGSDFHFDGGKRKIGFPFFETDEALLRATHVRV